MNDKKVIVAGLVIFLIVVTYPFWSTPLIGAKVSRPALEKPVGETRCVEDKTFMRENHAQMLNEWRTLSVRNGVTSQEYGQYGTAYRLAPV